MSKSWETCSRRPWVSNFSFFFVCAALQEENCSPSNCSPSNCSPSTYPAAISNYDATKFLEHQVELMESEFFFSSLCSLAEAIMSNHAKRFFFFSPRDEWNYPIQRIEREAGDTH
jgi:hypothetical protein